MMEDYPVSMEKQGSVYSGITFLQQAYCVVGPLAMAAALIALSSCGTVNKNTSLEHAMRQVPTLQESAPDYMPEPPPGFINELNQPTYNR